MICRNTGNEVEPEMISDGVLKCPDCGELLDEGHLESLSCVVAVGTPFDGLTLFGPFTDGNEAVAWAESIKDEWVVVPLNGVRS